MQGQLSFPQGFGLTKFKKIEPKVARGNEFFTDFNANHNIQLGENFDIRKLTGIERRNFFHLEQTPEQLALRMLTELQSTFKMQGQEVMHCVLASTMPDINDIASRVESEGGIPVTPLNAACSNFAFTLKEAANIAQNSRELINRHIAIIYLELWRNVNMHNPAIAPIFGDVDIAAGFTHVDSTNAGLSIVRYEIRDVLARRIGIPYPGLWLNRCENGIESYRNPKFDRAPRVRPFVSPHGDADVSLAMDMDGHSLMKTAPATMVKVAVEIAKRNNLTTKDMSALISHRANARMANRMADCLNSEYPDQSPLLIAGKDRPWQPEDITMDMTYEGNGGGGSIPLSLHLHDERFGQGDTILCTAVGGGMGLRNWEVDPEKYPYHEIDRRDDDKGEITAGSVILKVA